jgi:peptidoglycan hydrolase-like protein with peptidoglycan-binding domain
MQVNFIGTCNGKFGSSTQKALKAFEREHSLPIDGIMSQHDYLELGLVNKRCPMLYSICGSYRFSRHCLRLETRLVRSKLFSAGNDRNDFIYSSRLRDRDAPFRRDQQLFRFLSERKLCYLGILRSKKRAQRY